MRTNSDDNAPQSANATLSRVIGNLTGDKKLRHAELVELSNLTQADLAAFRQAWKTIPVERRRDIVTRLVEIAEDNAEVTFNPIFRILLRDEDAEVRESAVEGLWEDDSPSLVDIFIRMMGKDASEDVQAAAAAALEQEKRKGKTPQELESTQKEADRKSAEAGAAEQAVKEKEAEIATAREEQKKQEEQVAAGRKAVEEKKQEVAEEKKEIQRDETALRIQKEPEKVQKELEKKSEDLATREKEVARREEAAKKGETDASIFEGRLYYLKIKEYLTGGHYNNEMCAISAATAKVVQKSPIANICGHKYDIFKDGVVVITHKGDHRAGHYLTLLDLKTLESKATGADAVFWRSFVEVKEDLVYAVLNKDEKYYLGRFDAAMKTMAVSKDQVDPDSFISFFGDLIYINGSDKKILVLNRDDLSTKGVVAP